MIQVWVASASKVVCKAAYINKFQVQTFIHYLFFFLFFGQSQIKVESEVMLE